MGHSQFDYESVNVNRQVSSRESLVDKFTEPNVFLANILLSIGAGLGHAGPPTPPLEFVQMPASSIESPLQPALPANVAIAVMLICA